MRLPWLLLLALTLSLGLVACGDDGDDDDMAGDDDDDMAGDDDDDMSTAPRVVSTSPSEGALGVLVDDPIVLTFSEPMSEPLVEAAWSSSSLPAEQLEFSWNGDSTILTVDASAVLEYPEGGLTVDRFGWEVVLDATAEDADGETLESAFMLTFDTARDITFTPANVSGKTGGANGAVTSPVLRVGDDDMNRTWRSFITVDVSDVPDGFIQVVEATVSVEQSTVTGDPFGQLGGVVRGLFLSEPIDGIGDAVAFGATGSDAFDVSGDASPGVKGGDATDGFDAALGSGPDEVSMRLEFPDARDDENDQDDVVYERPSVEIRFLAE